MNLLNDLTIKKFEFQNPRWRTAAILKTVKAQYFHNCSTDFDEIWHGMVMHIGLYSGLTIKISNFCKSKIALVTMLKITEIAQSGVRGVMAMGLASDSHSVHEI